MSMDQLIVCEDAVANISGFDYEGQPLNMVAAAGEIISVIGPDYSGKSAWTKMICGLERCGSGKVKIFDKDLDLYERNDWINLRRNIAFIEPKTALLSAANGLQNVMIPALYHQMDTAKNIKQEALSILDELVPDVDPYVLPAKLRDDQRFKVALARALILNPKAIVADSPFSLLDYAATKTLKRFLIDYAERNNILLVIVTHDIKFAQSRSDKILFVSHSHLDIYNDTQEIIDSHEPEITEFLGSKLQQ